MSGHSKWSTIKRQKGLNDAKRGQSFTKMANAITIAARLGGSGDVSSNARLRMAVEAARAINLPKENVQRAIDRGLGKLPGQTLEEVIYEGFGPAKVAYLIEAVTDNKMRTLSDIRNLFDRAGGTLGSNGVTAYMFDHKGEIKVNSKNSGVGSSPDILALARIMEEETLELIDLGADDVEDLTEDGNTKFLVYVEPNQLMEMSTKITQSGFTIDSAELVYLPNITTQISDSQQAEKVIAFTEKLEEHDDIQKVYANFDIDDKLLNPKS